MSSGETVALLPGEGVWAGWQLPFAPSRWVWTGRTGGPGGRVS